MRSNPRGNSLFIVIIFIALLFLLVMGANELVRSSLGKQQSLMEGTRAYYAAEAGSEYALLAIKGHLPGFEAGQEFIALPHTPQRSSVPLTLGALQPFASFRIENRTATLPATSSTPVQLEPSIPLSLPLFEDRSALGSGQVDIQDFNSTLILEYKTPVPEYSPSTPCIRWDLSGFRDDNSQITESIGGVIMCNQKRFDTQLERAIYKDTVSPVPAQSISIQQFLQAHTQSYLTLTNLYPAGPLSLELRTASPNNTIARPFATLASNGQLCSTPEQAACKVQQAIDTIIPQGQILPIFNYTIFQ